jgi:hypothetical protein
LRGELAIDHRHDGEEFEAARCHLGTQLSRQLGGRDRRQAGRIEIAAGGKDDAVGSDQRATIGVAERQLPGGAGDRRHRPQERAAFPVLQLQQHASVVRRSTRPDNRCFRTRVVQAQTRGAPRRRYFIESVQAFS